MSYKQKPIIAGSANEKKYLNNVTSGEYIRSGKRNFPSGQNMGVRQTLTAAGLDNGRIGWDGQYVTYDGRRILQPQTNLSSTTYSDAADIFGAYSRATGSNMLDVTQGAAMSGMSNAVEYGEGGNVFIGGVPLQNAVIINGQAYAPANDINNAIQSAKGANGYSSTNQIYNNYAADTSSRRNALLGKIKNYGSFSYNPESDPVYSAYKKSYTTQAKRAAEDLRGKMSSATDGYANSAAIAAGAQAYYNHMQQLTDQIPTLANDAHNRYKYDYERLFNELELYGSPKNMYEYNQNAAAAQRKEVNDALIADYNRSVSSRDHNLKSRYTDAQISEMNGNIDYKKNLLPYEQELKSANTLGKRLDNDYKIKTFNDKVSAASLENEYKKSAIRKNYSK